MNKCCRNCKYYHTLKHNFTVGEGFKLSHACVALFYEEGDEDDVFMVEVAPDDMCEMFDEVSR